MKQIIDFMRFFAVAVALMTGAAAAQSDEGVMFELGAADAPVEVIEIVSLGCPTCRNFHRNGAFDVFREGYIDKGHVRWVIRDHFWTKFDFWTSRIVRCGDPAGREARMDKALERQSYINQDKDPQGVVNRLVEVATNEMGMTRSEADGCLQDAVGAELHVSTHRIFLDRYNLRDNPAFGTPFFIIDGEPIWNVDGIVDYEKVNAVIARKVIGSE